MADEYDRTTETDHIYVNESSITALLNVTMEVRDRVGRLEQKINVVPHERHKEEHDYIRLEMESKQATRDFYRSVTERLATSGILGAAGLLVTALGYALYHWIINLRPGS